MVAYALIFENYGQNVGGDQSPPVLTVVVPMLWTLE